MLPTHLLPQLSPAAAKLYLALSRLTQDPHNPDPDLTLKNLSRLCNFSRSTCLRALRQLRALKLVKRDPQPSPAKPPLGSDTPPVTPQSDQAVSPLTPPSRSTPVSNSKTPLPSPVTPQLTSTPPIAPDVSLRPAALCQCLAAASPALRDQILHTARQILERPNATPEIRATAIATLAAAASLNALNSPDPLTPLPEPHP